MPPHVRELCHPCANTVLHLCHTSLQAEAKCRADLDSAVTSAVHAARSEIAREGAATLEQASRLQASVAAQVGKALEAAEAGCADVLLTTFTVKWPNPEFNH